LAKNTKWKWPTAKFNYEWPLAIANFLTVKLNVIEQAIMKKIIVSLTALIIGMSCFCQHADSLQSIKAEYLKQSKNQKTAAWVLLGGGIAMTITGMIIFSNDYNNAVLDDPWAVGTNTNPTGAVIGTVGLLSCAGSIPLFVASGKNKKRAMAISTSFKLEKASVIQGPAFVKKSYPALSVKIGL
jgi:hypothetical protein